MRQGEHWTLHTGDAREVVKTLPRGHFAAVVTSPPYFGQREYGTEDDEIGRIADGLKGYLAAVVNTLDTLIPTLRKDAVVWLNVQDVYNAYNRNRGAGGQLASRRDGSRGRQEHVGLMVPGIPNKSLLGIPARLQVALIDAGWTCRADVTWVKPAMPERVRDRPVRQSERLFMLTRTDRYGHPPVPGEPTDVWRLPTASGADQHSARFSTSLAHSCLSWCPAGPVLDPFSGSASTGEVALRLGREYVGIDLQDDFNRDAAVRLDGVAHSTGHPSIGWAGVHVSTGSPAVPGAGDGGDEPAGADVDGVFLPGRERAPGVDRGDPGRRRVLPGR